jgi:trans-aconitate methyltransferase
MTFNPRQHDPTLFAGTAAYYSRYRFPYPSQLFDHLAQTLSFDGTGTAIDLGCGPGLLTTHLAQYFQKVIAIDPDDEMLAEAHGAAKAAQLRNIEFMKGSSWELPPLPSDIKLAIMGQSFHWMDRDGILRRLHELLQPQGGLAVVYQERNPPAEIQKAEDETIREFLGEKRRAGQGYYEDPPDTHEEVLARSPFTVLTPWRYSYEREQSIEGAIGYQFSTTRATTRLLGDQAGRFRSELARRLLQAAPTGNFKLRVDVTALLAHKADT